MWIGQLCEETMRIETLLSVLQPMTIRGDLNTDVVGIAYDSRQVRPGYLFVALPGQRDDGRRYIDDAIRRGAVAVVSEGREVARARDVVWIVVEDARRALAEISAAFHGNPAAQLELIGVTGTNGKTTTTFMLRDIFLAAGRQPGLIGTVVYEIGARRIPAIRTTPESSDLHDMLAQMVRAGCRSAILEVSSHALEQKRVWGLDFDVGVFTNLTRDHLDYHGTMERYFHAKARLFHMLGSMEKRATAVINLDDPWGQQLAQLEARWAELITFGAHPAATVRVDQIEISAEGSSCRVITPWGEFDLTLSVLGRFNIWNALAAMAVAGARGIPMDLVVATLRHFHGAPGRLERIPNRKGLDVFVDYAHTDDALDHVLTTLREVCRGHLYVVFGCGGNRDRSKRPLMGRVAGLRADYVILTNDNPREEDPMQILREIEQGIPPGSSYEIIPDREAAIARAIQLARSGDMVLIAGKGHETCQEFARSVVPFDDRLVARHYLEQL